MTDKDRNSQAADRSSRDGVQQQRPQSDDAYASDIPAPDASRDDAQVKGGVYNKYQQQLGT